MPFLAECTDDEDEVLLAMAEELGNLITHVGGPSQCFCLLAPLETLAVTEETVVRDAAAASLKKVAAAMDAQSIQAHFVPLVTRLATGEWFTCRVSAAGLFAAAFQHLGSAADASQRSVLQEAFQRLAKDETPMVRRAVAQSLASFASAGDAATVETFVMPIFVLKSLINSSITAVAIGSKPADGSS